MKQGRWLAGAALVGLCGVWPLARSDGEQPDQGGSRLRASEAPMPNGGNFWEGSKALSVGLQAKADAKKPGLNYRWANAPIRGGGFVSGVLYHPAERGLVYLRTDVGGVFRWDASSRQWEPLLDALSHDNNQLNGVISLALDPSNPDLLYAAGGQYLGDWAQSAALLRSDDRGASWQPVKLPFKLGGNSDGRSTGERLQVDPRKGAILLLGTNRDGLWKSADYGRSWSKVNAFPAAGVTLVLFDPRSGANGEGSSTIYAGTEDSGLLRSTDGGASWAQLAGQPAGLMPRHAALDAGGTLYLSYGNGLGPNGLNSGAVWKYDTAGGKWTEITPLKPGADDSFGYGGLALDAQHPGTLMVATLDRWGRGDEIFRSTDGGHTWTALGAKARFDTGDSTWVSAYSGGAVTRLGHWIDALAINPFDANDAIYGTGYGIWRSKNLGAADGGGAVNWLFDDAGLEETAVLELISPPKGAPLLSALGDIGGFRHDDPAVPAPYFTPWGGSNRSLDFAESQPDFMVRTVDQGPAHAYRSADGGASWTPLAGAPASLQAQGESGRIAISADGTRLVWIPPKSAPYSSADQGKTWSKSGGPFQLTDTLLPVADRVNPAKFYIQDLNNGVVYASVDGGASFAPVRRLPDGSTRMRAVPGREGDLWVPLGWNGLVRSTDGGGNFNQLPKVQQAYAIGFGKAAPHKDYPAVFIWGVINDVEGLFRSDDEGHKWVRINDDAHRYGWIDVIAGDPRTFGRVYLGAGGRGIVYGEIAGEAGR